MVADIGALAQQFVHDGQGRRFANVVDIPLVSDAQDQHPRALQRLSLLVQSVLNKLNDVPGHMGIHLFGEAYESGLEPVQPRFPGQIVRI